MAQRPTGRWDPFPDHTKLRDDARICAGSLRGLLVLAGEKPILRRSSNSETIQYLGAKETVVRNIFSQFERWQTEIGQPPYSHRQSVNSANVKLNRLRVSIDTAKGVLEKRLKLYTYNMQRNIDKRKEYEDQFDRLLLDLQAIIGELNGLTTSLKRAVPRALPKHEDPLYTRFCAALKDYKKEEAGDLPLGQISVLWGAINMDQELRGRVGNPRNPGDGMNYHSSVMDQAEKALQMMHKALCSTFGADRLVNGQKELTRFIHIFVILKHLHESYWTQFDAFLRRGKYKLPFTIDELKAIVGSQHRTFIDYFFAEQHRIRERTWPGDPGDIVSIDPREPLPYRVTRNPKPQKGGFGYVFEVTNVFTQEKLVLKMQKDENDYLQSHFVEEIKILRKLVGVRHVAQLKQSYCREGLYGFLLQPGEEDLFDYLARLCGSMPSQQSIIESEPAILTAFGCLSLSLAKIHAKRIRHKDIKPGNIVHDHDARKGVHDFFIIDFSVAHDFYNEMDSRSQFQERYSPEYAAPEVMKERGDEKENQATPGFWPTESPDSLATTVSGVGRKADIFSLGLVFLEILSILVGEQHQKPVPNSFRACRRFYQHLPELQLWIRTQIEKLKHNNQGRALIPIFEICSVMIQYDPADRYTAEEVALKVAEIENRFCCKDCLDEIRRIKCKELVLAKLRDDHLSGAESLEGNEFSLSY